MPIILTSRHIVGLWRDAEGRVPPIEFRTLDLLKARQADYCAQNPATAPIQEIATPAQAHVGNGCWRIECRCGEATHTDPEWATACCFGCGAVYTSVTFPADRADIEALLVERPVQGHRNWSAAETLEDLYTEQVAHGDPVPDRAAIGLPEVGQ